MAKFGHTFVSGLIWIAILVLVAVFGRRIPGPIGTVVHYGALSLVGLFGWHLIRSTHGQWRAVRMMKQDPEGFWRLKQDYESALDRLDQRDE